MNRALVRSAFSSLKQRSFASISYSQFGSPTAVCKVTDANDNQAPSGPEVSIKSCEVTVDDIRNISGTCLRSKQAGVAGETGLGVISNVDQANLATMNVGDPVFVVGQGFGTWRNKGVFPTSSIFNVTKSVLDKNAQLSSALLAYGALTKYTKLSKGDVVLISKKASPVTSALSQIASHMGAKVVTASLEELTGRDNFTKIKANGTIKLAIVYNDPKLVKAFYKAVDKNGSLVIYNDQVEKLEDIDGLHLSVSHSVFDNISVAGINVSTWAQNDPKGFQDAVTEVCQLIDSKVISTLPAAQVYPHTKYTNAVNDVLQGKAAVLTF